MYWPRRQGARRETDDDFLHPADTPLAAIAALGNIVVIAASLVLLNFIRGRITPPQHAASAA